MQDGYHVHRMKWWCIGLLLRYFAWSHVIVFAQAFHVIEHHSPPPLSVITHNRWPSFMHKTSLIDDRTLLASLLSQSLSVGSKNLPHDQTDTVERLFDANTLKLSRSGLVSFAGVRTPSPTSFQFPECLDVSPSSKVRRLLPAGTKVRIKFIDDNDSNNRKNIRKAFVVRDVDDMFINEELIRSGFAIPSAGSERTRQSIEQIIPGFSNEIKILHEEAMKKMSGIYKSCDDRDTVQNGEPINFDDQFEPMELTVETQWGADGGKQIIREKENPQMNTERPKNPGDTKGCSDFKYYEDALKWYEKYYPYYGDVAKLDRDEDGVPCPGLPHTKDMERYRKKIPVDRK